MNSEISYNTFTQNLYNQVSIENDANLVISPLSIFMSLLMCFAGAKGNTYQQIRQILNISNLLDQQAFDYNKNFMSYSQVFFENNPQLRIANKIYVQKDYKITQSFEHLVQTYFKNNFQQLDFSDSSQSSQSINSWISVQTNDKIKQVIEPTSINSNTKLILVNAIYLKASWISLFDQSLTTNEDFTLSNGQTVKVPMMKLYDANFKHLFKPAGIEASTVEIPYEGEKLAMTIILPNVGSDLKKVEKQLNLKNVQAILSLRMIKEPIDIFIPRFSVESNLNLKNSLIKLGGSSLFDSTANFTGISGKNGLVISEVIHKTTFEIDEYGTEASAANTINFGVYSSKQDVKRLKFWCNKPFIYIVHEKTYNNILFIGKYIRP